MISFALGLFFGACIGFFVASILSAAKDPEIESALDVGLGFRADDLEIPAFIRHQEETLPRPRKERE